jgi:RecA-family ATPase
VNYNAFIPPTDLNKLFLDEQPIRPNGMDVHHVPALTDDKTLAHIYRFNSALIIEKPTAIIGIDDHILATKGNIMTIAGQAKAGKSGVISAFLAGTLAIKGDIIDTLGFKVERNDTDKAVIHIDSEQSRYDHYKGMMRVLKRASRSKEPPWFHSYNFQLTPIKDRIKLLRKLCEESAQAHSGIHLIIVDGGADFVLDTNDPKESNEMIRLFSELAIDFECPVIVVLHFNPGTEKGRGHFGSQLERKSETVVSVNKDLKSEISTIEGKFLRNSGNIPKLQFIYSQEKGYHIYYGIQLKTTAEEKKLERLKKLSTDIFDGTADEFTYTDLYKRIITISGVKERAAKENISYLTSREIISCNDGKYKRVSDNKRG